MWKNKQTYLLLFVCLLAVSIFAEAQRTNPGVTQSSPPPQPSRASGMPAGFEMVAVERDKALNDGFIFLSKGEYEKAAEVFEEAVNKGSIHAEFAIAMMIHNGQHYPQDYDRAYMRFSKLHMDDYYAATFVVGVYLENGWHGETNYERAFTMYEKAAMFGKISRAWKAMGNLYMNGRGVERDVEEAISCFEVAADGNDREAMYNLGLIYLRGNDVEADYEEARDWFEQAAELGEPKSMYHIGELYRLGYGVEKDMDKALEWYIKSMEGGYSHAGRLAYPLLMEGNKEQIARGLEIMEGLVESGDPEAQFELGMHYLRGEVIAQDAAKAVDLIGKAANEEYLPALYTLGLLHAEGYLGGASDKQKGLEMIQKAADLKYDMAIQYLQQKQQ